MAFDIDAYRDESRQTWSQMASGWEKRNEWMIDVAGAVNQWIADRADPQPGETFVDLAAGPGDLGFRVAERLGDAGRLISADFAPEMVEAARRVGERRGIGNVEYRVMDAEQMDLEDASVDGVVCRWGYMLMADPQTALRETKRVLRDGGRVAFAVFGAPDRNPWASIPAMTLVELGHMPPPDPAAPGIFALADPGRIGELLAGAGLEGEPEEIRFEFRYADSDDLWDVLLSLAGPLARVIAPLGDEERAAVRAAIEEKATGFRADDGSYRVPAVCWGVLAH